MTKKLKSFVCIFLSLILIVSIFSINVSAFDVTIISPADSSSFYQGIHWEYNEKGKIEFMRDIILDGLKFEINNGTSIEQFAYDIDNTNVVEPPSGWKLGKNTVTLNFHQNKAFATSFTYEITIVKITSAKITRQPWKTILYNGSDWNYNKSNEIVVPNISIDGLKALITYSDGRERETILSNRGFSVPDEYVLGENIIKVNYGGYYVPVTYSIVENPPVSATVVTSPDSIVLDYMTDWIYDDQGKIKITNLDLTGMSIQLTYKDSSKKVFDSSYINWEIPEGKTLEVGGNVILAVCQGFKINMNIYISDKTIDADIISISVVPTSTVNNIVYKTNWIYENGKISVKSINFRGLTISINYSDSSSDHISYISGGSDFSWKFEEDIVVGSNELTIIYRNTFKTTLNINVTAPNISIGDINNDTFINSSDALLALKSSVSQITLTTAQNYAGDVNGDGKVNSTDALLILQHSVGKIKKFPIEK